MARDFDAQLSIGEVSALRVLAFNAIHQAGRPFLVDAEGVLGGDHDLEDLAGQVGKLSFGAVGEEPRVLHGIVEAATLLADEQGGLATLRDVYKLPVSTADGPFTAVNRVGVVLKPHAQLSSVDVEFGFGLPGVVSHKGLADLARMREVLVGAEWVFN